jgi:hypothetical protein
VDYLPGWHIHLVIDLMAKVQEYYKGLQYLKRKTFMCVHYHLTCETSMSERISKMGLGEGPFGSPIDSLVIHCLMRFYLVASHGVRIIPACLPEMQLQETENPKWLLRKSSTHNNPLTLMCNTSNVGFLTEQ